MALCARCHAKQAEIKCMMRHEHATLACLSPMPCAHARPCVPCDDVVPAGHVPCQVMPQCQTVGSDHVSPALLVPTPSHPGAGDLVLGQLGQ